MMHEGWTIEFKEEPPTTVAVFGYFKGFADVLETAHFYGQQVRVITWRDGFCETDGTR